MNQVWIESTSIFSLLTGLQKKIVCFGTGFEANPNAFCNSWSERLIKHVSEHSEIFRSESLIQTEPEPGLNRTCFREKKLVLLNTDIIFQSKLYHKGLKSNNTLMKIERNLKTVSTKSTWISRLCIGQKNQKFLMITFSFKVDRTINENYFGKTI